MENLIFEKAELKDIDGILAIEKEYFGSYNRALDKDDMIQWFNHNPDMFYVVKDNEEEVLAATILVPVVKDLYAKLKTGEISDLYDFKKNEVPTKFMSDYFHLESACASKSKGKHIFSLAAIIMLRGLIEVIYNNAKYVSTSPITEDGIRTTENMGFVHLSNEMYEGKEYPVCELVVNEKKYNKLSQKYDKFLKKYEELLTRYNNNNKVR